MEIKELRCECGCNLFTVRKVRDVESVFQRKGSRVFFCVDCDSHIRSETKWVMVDGWVREIISDRWERMKTRISRLSRNTERMQNWIDSMVTAE